ncbi:MAG TPA: hypothetical protein VGP76_21945 [Planctomycetaceae bacterium]|nr:hypothetical protein [Planctomycetaceae bacterium]
MKRSTVLRLATKLIEKIDMNQQHASSTQEETSLDTFAAELTETAYPIALKYGVRGSSLDLQLEIWKAVIELVRKRGRDLLCPPAVGSVAGGRRQGPT